MNAIPAGTATWPKCRTVVGQHTGFDFHRESRRHGWRPFRI